MVLALSLFAGCGAWSLSRTSAVFDETTHLPSGFTYLDQHDFRHNSEHPPLAKAWAALPLWLLGLARVDTASPNWVGTHVPPGDPQRSRADQWKFGFEFLNGRIGDPVRRDPGRLLVPARLAMLVPAMLLGLLVYAWATELWRKAGGLLALGLFAVSPTMLAHAGLVTTDLPSALGFTATVWSFRGFIRDPSWRRSVGTGLCLGGALLAKYSTLLLGPILVLLAATWAAFGPAREERAAARRWALAAAGLAGAFLTAWVVIWAGYGFRYSASSDPGYRLEWESMAQGNDAGARGIQAARRARILPESYLFGLAYAQGGASRRLAFLDGEETIVGRWRYFPEAFLLKTPLAFVLLLAWVLAAAAARTRGRSFEGWYLATTPVLYLAASMAGNLNIGHRHLVPIYPFLFVAAGGAASFLAASRAKRWATVLLLAGCGVSFVLTTPRYLSYFNLLGGGNRGGWHHLVDSNIDWGQDLPALKAWIDAHGGETVYLAYFGTADPKAYGIPYRKVILVHDFYPAEPSSRPGPGELLAVSVTLLQGVYLESDRELAEESVRRGWVPMPKIKEWVALRDERSARGQRYPRIADWLVATGALSDEQRREAETPLLSTWMRRIRDSLVPVGRAGDSILIYRMP